MDAVEFLMKKSRYCDVNGCSCEECQIYNECGVALDKLTEKQAERMVNVIGQWAEVHPIKTRQSEFLKMFPNAFMDGQVLNLCPKGFEGRMDCTNRYDCANCRREYWLQEVE